VRNKSIASKSISAKGDAKGKALKRLSSSRKHVAIEAL